MEEGASQLIFIEVRYRSKDLYGSPVETITQLKRKGYVAPPRIFYFLTVSIRLLPVVLTSSD